MNERIQQTCVEAAPWLRVVAGTKFSGAFVCGCYESGAAWPAWHHASAPPPPESPIRSFEHTLNARHTTNQIIRHKQISCSNFLVQAPKVYTIFFWPSPVLGWPSSQPTSLLSDDTSNKCHYGKPSSSSRWWRRIHWTVSTSTCWAPERWCQDSLRRVRKFRWRSGQWIQRLMSSNPSVCPPR
jgi:hypothetical protein